MPDPNEHPAAPRASAALCSEIPADVPEWVMICRTGAWEHPQHPDQQLSIASTHLEAALAYYERHYEGYTDVVIDYHHQSALAAKGFTPRAPAAGWINDMEIRGDGTELWGHVLWTAEAREAIAARQFRYLSPHVQSGTDRITGEPVLMRIPDVALTNQPYITELEALNAATDGGDAPGREGGHSEEGDESMKLIEALAQALGIQPEEAASRLGLDAGAEDKVAAEALCALPAKVTELEAKVTEQRPVSDAVADALGVDHGADETVVKAALLTLQAGGEIGAVRAKLGLGEDKGVQDVLATLDGLQETRHRQRAEQVVDDAVKAGKVPPAQRDFFLSAALNDLDATEMAIRGAPIITALAQIPHMPDVGGAKTLTGAQEHLCSKLGISKETFLLGA